MLLRWREDEYVMCHQRDADATSALIVASASHTSALTPVLGEQGLTTQSSASTTSSTSLAVAT
ncbi:MAG: hypothetical protein N2554_06185, partial [Fimbriimonadales bacterium]|nr:hypothetical protein [Fimbriimonadales bacterium]